MSAPVKTVESSLLTIVSTASNAITVGSALNVVSYHGADIRIRMGRGTGTAFTVAPIFRVEVSYVLSPNANQWVTACSFSPALGATIGSQAVSGTSNAADTTLLLAAGTNFAADNFIFIHNTTIANSEWKHVTSISSATLTLQEGLVFAQTGSTARNQAEEYHALLDVTAVQNIRLVVDGASGSGQAVVVESGVALVTL